MARASMRDAIVEAAIDRFWVGGFHGTGIQEVATAAGVPKGSIYNHFRSKEELAAAALAEWGKTRRFVLLADNDVDPATRIRANFEFLAAEFVDNGLVRGCLLGNFAAEISADEVTLRAAIDEGFERWRAALTLALQAAADAGQLRTEIAPDALAAHLIGAWEGALLQARAMQSRAPLDAFFDLVFDQFVRQPEAG